MAQSNFPVLTKEAAEKTARSIFVGNIPYEATEEKLIELFSKAGPVIGFRLVYDRESGKPKGYGFCEYNNHAIAASALRNLQNIEFNGRPLRIGPAAGEQNSAELALSNPAVGPPLESPYGDPVDPQTAPETISRAVASLPPEQMYELMKQMKLCIQNNPNEARNILLQNPQLAYALLQAQIVMKIVDPKVAIAMLNRSHDQIPPAMPDDREPPVKITMPAPPPTVSSSMPGTATANPSMPPVMMNPNIASGNVHGMPSNSYPPQNAGMMPAGPGGNLPPGPYAVDPHAMNGPPNTNTMMPNFYPGGPMPPGGSGNFQPVPTSGPPPAQSMNYDYPGPSATRPPMPSPQMGFRPNGPGPMQQTPPRPVPPPPPGSQQITPAIAAAAAASMGPNSLLAGQGEQEKVALIMQVLQLSDEQLAMLPDDQRRSIMILKEQLGKTGAI
ncbi:Cleavage stimulation factor subunit [Fasciola hepatica]|uniref:Cleavage stimulation factor subunit n=1 Tax=Fasciola hepatica TaxID=6192 RepID=A0A4E0R5R4_FASHE|nr:Cleavage stimulation factor subunit [Fasciola hepatica]